jgi:hypothetical protein
MTVVMPVTLRFTLTEDFLPSSIALTNEPISSGEVPVILIVGLVIGVMIIFGAVILVVSFKACRKGRNETELFTEQSSGDDTETHDPTIEDPLMSHDSLALSMTMVDMNTTTPDYQDSPNRILVGMSLI